MNLLSLLLLFACENRDGKDHEPCTSQLQFRDADGDGYGDPALTTTSCAAAAGWVDSTGDCNDADPAVHPTAVESCDYAYPVFYYPVGRTTNEPCTL